ncbi:MAG TPA: hypothetical protein VM715_04800 [Candidatus Acidoferrum sp.]|nr:hypothetical protein [Candidatus Acidoferrum sp.]
MAETTELGVFVKKTYEEFNKLCKHRHEVGRAEYGEFTFLDMDVISMAQEECADLANYARFLYTKLELLKYALTQGGFFAGSPDSPSEPDNSSTATGLGEE